MIYRNMPYAGVPEDVNDLIPITTTRMHFGGVVAGRINRSRTKKAQVPVEGGRDLGPCGFCNREIEHAHVWLSFRKHQGSSSPS